MTAGARAARYAPGHRSEIRIEPPQKAGRTELAPSMLVDEALRVIVASLVVYLRANEGGLFASEDPEYVHQMRVAVRRLRSALRLFPGSASAGLHGKHARTLRKVADRLGKVRDLDVLAASVSASGVLPRVRENQVMMAIRLQAQIARDDARSCLRSADYAQLMSRIALWLLARPRHRTAIRLVALARRELAGRHKALMHRAACFARLAAEERHRFRIDVKRARYAAEFFASLFDHRAAQAYAGALAKLQDLLGSLTDINTAQALLRELGCDEKIEQCLMDAWSRHAVADDELEGVIRTCAEAAGFWKRNRR